MNLEKLRELRANSIEIENLTLKIKALKNKVNKIENKEIVVKEILDAWENTLLLAEDGEIPAISNLKSVDDSFREWLMNNYKKEYINYYKFKETSERQK